jgi:hypothetical protein
VPEQGGYFCKKKFLHIADNEFFRRNFKKSVSLLPVKTGKKMLAKKGQSLNSAKLINRQ